MLVRLISEKKNNWITEKVEMFISKTKYFLKIDLKNLKTAILVDLSRFFFLRYEKKQSFLQKCEYLKSF